MNQEILKKLKNTPELSPDVHDGSYELVRAIVSAYRDVDEAVLDYHDLNAIYLMCIGTWRHSYDKKHEAVHATHLPEVRKQELDHLIDELKSRADAGVYKHQEKAVSGTGHIGMFGTGFYSFQNKTDPKSVRDFIQMCLDLLDMTDDEEMFQRAGLVLTKSFHGMQAAAASVVLHCLKPLTFPVINSNVGSEDIFAALGIQLEARGKLETYIENCRKIKVFRDANFSFKNYRVLDMAAWALGKEQNATKRLLAQYKENLDAWIPEEIYKWRAVKCFQDHWNPDAHDFAQMLKDSLRQSRNLLDHGRAYPRKMITNFAEAEPETVRQMFRNLFSEDRSLTERVSAFSLEADGLLTRHKTKASMKRHYQSDRTICTDLFFAYPDRYYLYQFRKLRDFAAEVEYDLDCKTGEPQNIYTYMELADQVRNEVQQDPELIQKVTSRLDDTCYQDEQLHLLTDDLIYFGCQIHRGKYWPAISDYDPGITTEDWQELLQSRDICTRECEEILEQIYVLGGEATCTQLSARYGNTPSYYNMSLIRLAKRVHAQTNCPLAQTEDGEKKWWPILFIGRTALQGQSGTYSWKLRDELEDALEFLPQKEVNNPMPFAKNTILYGPLGRGRPIRRSTMPWRS